MKLKLITILVTVVTIQAASAISLVGVGEWLPPMPPQVNFEGLPANGPQTGLSVATGVLLDYNSSVVVQAVDNDNGTIPLINFGNYLSVLAGGEATLSFNTAQDLIGFIWGTVDAYNTVEFFLESVSKQSFTGTDIAEFVGEGFPDTGLVSIFAFFSGSFDEVVFTSTSNSFEIDSIYFENSVPASGSTIVVLGFGLIGIGVASRRFKK